MKTSELLEHEVMALLPDAMLPAGNSLREKLATYINHLILNDQHTLLFLLYRVDVSEQKIKSLLQSATDSAGLIADVIIERQLQKINLRKQFRQDSNNIPEEDRW